MSEAETGADEARWGRGLAIMDEVYGAGFSTMMTDVERSPFVEETTAHLFGEIWSRPGFSVRERRLMVLGATTMLGRADLIEIQMVGALANGEFTDEQLAELPLFLMFYCGAGNTTALHKGIEAARARHAAKGAAKLP